MKTTVTTPLGEVGIEVFGHASVCFTFAGKRIYCDPYSEVCSFRCKPKADLMLITHNHYDHYDPKAFGKIETSRTRFVVSRNVGKVDERYEVLENGDSISWEGIGISAVPSYNVNRRNEKGDLFHPKGVGNGYLLDFGGFVIYLAGDTEEIPEMAELPRVGLAFLPKNLPFTMSDDEFVKAANDLEPSMLVAYHYFEIDTAALRKSLKPSIRLLND